MFKFMLLPRWQAVLLSVGIVAGMAGGMAYREFQAEEPEPVKVQKPVDPVRVRAWEKIEARLAVFDQAAESHDQHFEGVKEFFAERRGHAEAFAEDILGWEAKWILVKGKLSGDGGASHKAHMRECFAKHIFTDQEIKNLLQAAIASYLSALEGKENAILTEIQGDLSEEDLPALRVLALQSDAETFRAEYQRMIGQVSAVAGRDLNVTLGREVVVWVGSDIAGAVAVRIGAAIAVRLGISSGILGSGVASGAASLGIGIAVGFLVDGVVDWGMKKAGYDPAGDVVREVSSALSRVENLMIDGDPNNGGGGLRYELNRLRDARSQLRKEALRKLILEGGAP